MAKKTAKLINPETGLMKCQVCGQEWAANVKPDSGGKYYRGSWQCPKGCKTSKK